MASNALEEVVSMLLQIKHSLQRGTNISCREFLGKIDLCISKVIPFVNILNNKANSISESQQSPSNWRPKSTILDRSDLKFSVNSLEYLEIRKSANAQILKVNKSFIRREVSNEQQSSIIQKEIEDNSILLDYFVLKYNLSLNEYIVFGKKGGAKTDRKVFVDLLTFQNKRLHVAKLQKTQSMTNVLKEIFSQSKASEPFILPNYQQEQIRYLFVFGITECASIAEEYYRTETMCCFISNQFIVGELMHLMNEISKVCFQQQVYEASHAQERCLAETISLLHGKKSFQRMERVVEDYLQKKGNLLSGSKLFNSKSEISYPNSMDDYLQRCETLWSSVRRGKQKRLFLTLVLLYYLALSEYKIIILAKNDKKHLISELNLGLMKALEPLTFVYPIVGTTITPHHFQFANSPVPIFVGFWGNDKQYKTAKQSFKDMLKTQNNMSAEELSSQTLLSVVDLQENTLSFLESSFPKVCAICLKIQDFIESQKKDLISNKLSRLTKMLTQGYRAEDWMLKLAKNMKVTQMYDYYASRK